MKLLIYWGSDDKADLQVPHEVKWEDGSPASLEDYYRNQGTQVSESTEKGLVTVIFPEVVAKTKYDLSKKRWFLEAPGGGPFYLEQTDPAATDEELKHEIGSYPVAYRAVIDRSHLPDAAPTRA